MMLKKLHLHGKKGMALLRMSDLLTHKKLRMSVECSQKIKKNPNRYFLKDSS